MFVEVRKAIMVKLNRGAAARIEKCRAEGLCVACMLPLDSGRVIRGCHETCRRATETGVINGDWTEEARIADGKLLPPKPGRRPSNPVTLEARS